jgi:tetratricopeptide (TPR) repeat protein
LLAWHYDAAANLRLGRFARAESSARQAIRIDDQHLLPRAEYVLGAALAERHDLNGAAEHLQRYLTLEPDGEFAAAARTGLDEIRKTATRP